MSKTNLSNLTVKEQCSAITGLVTKFIEDLGFDCQGSDYGQDLQLENQKGEIIQFNKGYFGANSEPNVLGNWMDYRDISDEALEAEKQIQVYIDQLRTSILKK